MTKNFNLFLIAATAAAVGGAAVSISVYVTQELLVPPVTEIRIDEDRIATIVAEKMAAAEDARAEKLAAQARRVNCKLSSYPGHVSRECK